MTQYFCCVPGCPITSADGVPLHRFPDPERNVDKFKSWISNVGGVLSTLDPVYIYNNKRVCRKHFKDCHKYPKNRLCKLAVPVMHIPGLPEFQAVTEVQADIPSISAEHTISIEPKHVFAIGGYSSVPALQEEEPCRLCVRKRMHPSSAPQTYGKRVRKQLLVEDNVPDYNQPSTSGTQEVQSDIPIPQPDKINEKTQGQHNRTKTLRSNSSKNNSRAKKGVRLTLAEHKQYKLLLKKLQKAENDKNSYKKKYIMAKKMKKTAAFNIISKKMSPTSKIFCQMQVSQSGKKKQGRRFTLNEKILALSLYKPSPKSYRLLSKLCVLPGRKTLQNLLQRITLKPGINNLIFSNLKQKVEKMPEYHKYCVLSFDEMAIGPGVSYDKKKDMVMGLVNDGHTSTTEFCDHALVFMIRGTVKKFKQPLAYYFCHGSTKTVQLKAQIESVIKKIHETGLKVIATVCDQGASNIAAVNQLVKQTKEKYLRTGQEIKEEFFEIQNKKIFPIFDPPHLIKGIRNNLMTKHLKYVMERKVCVAKWEHIVALYNRSPGYKGVKLVPKLTAQHVLPDYIPKMRVKHCTQVFSKSVGVALGYMAESGAIDKKSTETADLLMFFDDLFDSVNGSFSQVRGGKIYRAAVTPTSPHHKLWAKSLPVLKTMQFGNAKNQGVVPSLTSWVKTIEGFRSIVKHLSLKGLNSLLLRNFNQDALENFFGAIRAHGYSNIMPTSSAFESAFKTLLINNISSSHSVGSNCEKDDSVCLQSLRSFLMKPVDETATESEEEIESTHLCIELLDTDELLQSKTPEHVERSAAIGYCSGWLAKLAKKHIYKNCVTCTNNMEETELQCFHQFIKIKEYEGKSWLCYPTRQLFDFFAQVERICIEILKEHSNKKKLSNYMKLIISINISVTFLSCTVHKEVLCKYLINKCTLFFIHNWCKDVNNVLNGKITFWDNDDPMKQKANKHYLKNKGRKRNRQNGIVLNV